jgi:hypothetical protein
MTSFKSERHRSLLLSKNIRNRRSFKPVARYEVVLLRHPCSGTHYVYSPWIMPLRWHGKGYTHTHPRADAPQDLGYRAKIPDLHLKLAYKS